MSNPIYIEGQNNTIISIPSDFLEFDDEPSQQQEDPFIQDEPTNIPINENLFPNMLIPEIPDNEFSINTNLICIPPSDLINLFNLFEPTIENFQNILIESLTSPYKHSILRPILFEWFSGNDSQIIESAFQTNRRPQRNNIWFFKIINHLSVPQKNIILEQYCNNTINPSCKIQGIDNFSFSDIRRKNYSKRSGLGVRVGEFMSDLKRVAAQIESLQIKPFILKMVKEGYKKPQLQFYSKTEFESKLKSLKICSKITGYSIYSAEQNSNIFIYDSISFFSSNPNIFSIFQGYDYPLLPSVDMTIIQQFMDHIHYIICSGQRDLTIYVVNWLSFLFQKPKEQIGTAIVLAGPQGAGKNTFSNVICHLLGEFATPNTSLEKVTGNFNDAIENKKLLVCNELKTFIRNKSFDTEKLKTLISDSNQNISLRYRQSYSTEIITNFIFISNNIAPVLIEEDDRRFVVCGVSSARVNDENYFNTFRSSLNDVFYTNLLTYFLRNNITNWNRFQIPMTNAKKIIMNYSRSPVSIFIQENHSKFQSGYQSSVAYKEYRKWCSSNGFKPCDIQEFELKISKYCDILESNHIRFYRLHRT